MCDTGTQAHALTWVNPKPKLPHQRSCRGTCPCSTGQHRSYRRQSCQHSRLMISIGALDLFSSFFMMATSSDLSVRARGFALSLPTRPPMTTTRTGKCPSTRAGHTLPHEQGRTSITTEKNGDDKPCRSPWHHISSAEDVGKRTLHQGHLASGRAGPQRHVLETVFRRAIQHRTTSIPFRAIALALPVAFGNISLSPLAICIPHLSEIRSTLATKPSQPYEGPCFERVCIAITPLISTRHHFSSARRPSAHQDTSGHKEDARQARRAIVATTESQPHRCPQRRSEAHVSVLERGRS